MFWGKYKSGSIELIEVPGVPTGYTSIQLQSSVYSKASFLLYI